MLYTVWCRPFPCYSILDPLTFSGTLAPDAAGALLKEGEYNGDAYYKVTGKAYYLWWNPTTSKWTVSILLGTVGTLGWASSYVLSAAYVPYGTATGTGTMVKTP